jgi:hypothetical protein
MSALRATLTRPGDRQADGDLAAFAIGTKTTERSGT